MRRWVNATAWIAGDAAKIQDALAGDPGEWLPRCTSSSDGAAGTGPDGGWDVVLRVGAVSQPLRVAVGPVRSAGPSWWRALSWTPALHADAHVAAGELVTAAPAPAVRPPRLDAQLGTVPVATAPCPGGWAAGDSGLWLLLTGSYVPPLGVLGLPGDQEAVEQQADACATALVAQIADRLRVLGDAAGSRPAPATASACGGCHA